MIYILEDDDNIRELVVYTLNSTVQESRGFSKPSDFWDALEKQVPRLLLLDVMLPEEDGLSVLTRLRANPKTAKLPVIMVTAKGSEYDKVKGLDAGADDYIPKPFGMMELVARVKAMIRRTDDMQSAKTDYTIGCLSVSTSKHTAKVSGKEVTLTLKEFELLCLLFKNKDVVLSRDTILNSIWSYEFDGESRTVDVHIRTLRQKLCEAGKYIQTVRGIGYKLGAEN